MWIREHTLILKEGGRIYGAGRSDLISGIDGKTFQLIPGLGDDLVFIDIELGEKHSLALTQDFQVFGWDSTTMDNLDLETQRRE